MRRGRRRGKRKGESENKPNRKRVVVRKWRGEMKREIRAR
jgi:hypothetical protein